MRLNIQIKFSSSESYTHSSNQIARLAPGTDIASFNIEWDLLQIRPFNYDHPSQPIISKDFEQYPMREKGSYLIARVDIIEIYFFHDISKNLKALCPPTSFEGIVRNSGQVLSNLEL